MQTLLEARDLRVEYRDGANIKPVLEGIDFALRSGEVLGILGESGCGKTTLAYSLLQLQTSNLHFSGGSIQFERHEILNRSERDLQKIRGARLSLIFQEASLALHPTIRVGEQVSRVIAAHIALNRAQTLSKARDVLHEVFDADTDRIFYSYPHQLSGGQRQRVLIAQAIACNPSVLIADEPTASLDATTQSEILSLFAELRQRHEMAIIFITHNPALLTQLADRILVLYAGRVVEEGPAEILLRTPRHPYFRDLLRSMNDSPEAALLRHKMKIPAIEGVAPDLSEITSGCVFAPRCEDRMDECGQREPMTIATEENSTVACFKYGG